MKIYPKKREKLKEPLEYKSHKWDGKRTRSLITRPCEWCGHDIPEGQLLVSRSYTLSNEDYTQHHWTGMHHTCYDLAREYCAEYHHTFNRFNMAPLRFIAIGLESEVLRKSVLQSLKKNPFLLFSTKFSSYRHSKEQLGRS